MTAAFSVRTGSAGTRLLVLATAWAAFVALPAAGGPDLDSDGDGIPDVLDSCTLVANAAPLDCDTDQDGYGNACDGDFDQSLAVNATDFTGHFVPAFTGGTPTPTGTDMDCSGSVNATDFTAHFLPQFTAGTPGPSGLACAGTTPCP